MKEQSLLSTEPYKGVRDFYPEDMAIQQYIFDAWSKTAESFGYQRYDTSILEPSVLYKSKGSRNEEMVNEQTYTFTDRGDREVTLRPEMTPSVARLVAGKSRELSFPLRWYSIPNLFRYERPQRGRLREHWQLNCDMFGSNTIAADIEVVLLGRQILLDLGATPDMFKIYINDRVLMTRLYKALGVNEALIPAITRLNDRKSKIDPDTYREELSAILGSQTLTEEVIMMLEQSDEQSDLVFALNELGVDNVIFDKTLARGFDYYTGMIFEIFDTAQENNRSLIGGGRYDNLTSLFGDEKIGGVGFGMGDVSMRNFLETHNLLPADITKGGALVSILPLGAEEQLEAEKIALRLRNPKLSVSVDISSRKVGKKIAQAVEQGSKFAIIVGETEISSGIFSLKNLQDESEQTGTLEEIKEWLK